MISPVVTGKLCFSEIIPASFKIKEKQALNSDLFISFPLKSVCFNLIFLDFQAAARHHCNYLVYLHSDQFLRVGGDPLWLDGLEATPPRLRLLDHINKVLAHQPWLTACSHIQVKQSQMNRSQQNVHKRSTNENLLLITEILLISLELCRSTNSREPWHCSYFLSFPLFPPDAAEDGWAVLVAGWAGAGRGDPGPLSLPLQLCVWMWHKLRPGPCLQISSWYPANLLPLWCCQRQHQCASVVCHSLWTHNSTKGNKSDLYYWLIRHQTITERNALHFAN